MSERSDLPLFAGVDEALPAMVRSLLADRCSPVAVRRVVEQEVPEVEGLWATLGEVGWTSIEVAEPLGGAGGSFADLCTVGVEMGRALAGGMFVSSVVLGLYALTRGSAEVVRDDLADFVAGTRRAVVVGDLAPDPGRPPTLRTGPGGVVLDGSVAHVPDAAGADLLVVVATGDDGPVLVTVEATAPGVSVTPEAMVDVTRRFGRVDLARVRVRDDQVLAAGPGAAALIDDLAVRAAMAVACDSLGAAARALDETVGYARERVQFGRPIGSFQAVKHHCARMLVDLRMAGAAVDVGVGAWGPGAGRVEASTAKWMATDACASIAGTGMQIHGGIGFTWEHDMHLLLKRSKVNQELYGSASAHRERVAGALLAPAPSR